MTSNDKEIQTLYNKINNFIYNTFNDDEYEAEGKVQEELKKPILWDPLVLYLQKILGIEKIWKSNSINYKKPFIESRSSIGDKIYYSNNIKDLTWGENTYFIVFIEYGILISMTINMIKKIPILRSILLDENGNDKPLTLKYTSQYFENNVLSFQMNEEGPKLYITKLPLHSLLFDKPNDDWYIRECKNFHEEDKAPILEKYFKYDNIEEAIVNIDWY